MNDKGHPSPHDQFDDPPTPTISSSPSSLLTANVAITASTTSALLASTTEHENQASAPKVSSEEKKRKKFCHSTGSGNYSCIASLNNLALICLLKLTGGGVNENNFSLL